MNNNPYVGPRAFKTGELLYGREREIRELVALLIAERIVLMYSPSGAGKTSLIQAALIPALVEEDFQVLPTIRVSSDLSASEKAMIGTSNRYVLSALLSLERTWPRDRQLGLADLAAMSFSSYLDSDEIRRKEIEGQGRPTRRKQAKSRALIFDQFEELLTVDPTDAAAKEQFFEQVGAALRKRDCWALFSMREDYLAGLDPFLRHVPTRLVTKVRLDLLNERSSLLAIQQPAEREQVVFSNDAAEKLINDLRTVLVQQSDGSMQKQLGPHIEPVQLQVVCRRLWDKLPEDTREVVQADIETIGDVNSALSGYYSDQVKEVAQETKEAEGMETVSERAIREWFDNNLITEQGIRGQVLQGRNESKGLKNDVIWPLIDAHLVRAEKRHGATWFELAHDRLIDPVQADNSKWLQEHLNDFQRQAALWNKQGRPDTLLFHGQVLVEANDWARKHEKHLTTVEIDFLNKSLEIQKQTERERKQQERFRRKRQQALRNRAAAIVMTLISLIAVGALVIVAIQQNRLRQQNQAMQTANKDLQKETEEATKQRKLAEDLNEQLIRKQEEADKVGGLEEELRKAQLKIIEAESRKINKAIAAAGSPHNSSSGAGGSELSAAPLDTEAIQKSGKKLQEALKKLNQKNPTARTPP
jgi:hypothetical protein